MRFLPSGWTFPTAFVFGLRLGRAGVLISPGGMQCEDDNACVAGTVVVAGEYVAHLGSLEQWRWLHTRKEMPLDIAQAGPGLAAGIGLDASKDEVALGVIGGKPVLGQGRVLPVV